ncbi:hypothetical protein BDA99DRAFT_22648 [Phascolomyces articulosus]|uniref:Uncharacterized protein n=1 Tax=Phascolomyces articulosus TaxID=60185 RepID=A0AAD5PES6_9FUNG|nr:hypothetical protein BDA99DRAFT_22648 [Phascolomyces articulosus]
MTTSDVHVSSAPTFEPTPVPTGPNLRSTVSAPFYAQPFTFDFYNSTSTDPNLYSLNNPLAFTTSATTHPSSTSLPPCTYINNSCYPTTTTAITLSTLSTNTTTNAVPPSTCASFSSISIQQAVFPILVNFYRPMKNLVRSIDSFYIHHDKNER